MVDFDTFEAEFYNALSDATSSLKTMLDDSNCENLADASAVLNLAIERYMNIMNMRF